MIVHKMGVVLPDCSFLCSLYPWAKFHAILTLQISTSELTIKFPINSQQVLRHTCACMCFHAPSLSGPGMPRIHFVTSSLIGNLGSESTLFTIHHPVIHELYRCMYQFSPVDPRTFLRLATFPSLSAPPHCYKGTRCVSSQD